MKSMGLICPTPRPIALISPNCRTTAGGTIAYFPRAGLGGIPDGEMLETSEALPRTAQTSILVPQARGQGDAVRQLAGRSRSDWRRVRRGVRAGWRGRLLIRFRRGAWERVPAGLLRRVTILVGVWNRHFIRQQIGVWFAHLRLPRGRRRRSVVIGRPPGPCKYLRTPCATDWIERFAGHVMHGLCLKACGLCRQSAAGVVDMRLAGGQAADPAWCGWTRHWSVFREAGAAHRFDASRAA